MIRALLSLLVYVIALDCVQGVALTWPKFTPEVTFDVPVIFDPPHHREQVVIDDWESEAI